MKLKNIRVLLVDDEIFNFEMLDIALGSKYNLSYASSGQQGLSLSIEQSPQVILLDICMPGLDGYDTCRLLKNTPETKEIPIILLTGLDNEEEVNEGFMAGCDAYITKPFEMTELMTKIEHLSEL
ncbi:response regulator [Psychrosphaera aquimarina]|uniref:Response regulator n=1 Tax=Psychrosphaera aquimarina TaxID=2044854 RepID=A0ABU3QWU9_9GAMM|nr:response regulator [Psychrosphaera aquimarina]MDU0111907.1 response regulator [Psychrosphaera aquimarina]